MAYHENVVVLGYHKLINELINSRIKQCNHVISVLQTVQRRPVDPLHSLLYERFTTLIKFIHDIH